MLELLLGPGLGGGRLRCLLLDLGLDSFRLSFGLSYAWAAWDTDAARPFAEGHGQAWHDKLSGTFVVRV